MMAIIDKLFNFDKKRVKEIEKAVAPVETYAQVMADLTDEQLKYKTTEFKERIEDGATLDDILPEAFAAVREAAKRVIGEYPYPVQLMGAYVMHTGDIAEMKTGEGKTLTSVLSIYLNALEGKGVHVVTVNEYLAGRDAEWMGQIFKFMGLTVGLNARALNPVQKRNAYLCDITYSTNAELGFDYLRDNMVTRKEDRVLRGLNYALIDEVDSILIDESRTPLIISGGQRQTANLYKAADNFVKSLTSETDYEVDVKSKSVQLTESAVAKAEKIFKVNNLYDVSNTQLVHHLNQALKANYTMANDVEYVVEEDQIVIVDQFTGRKMPGRAFSDGLHQALEAKEGVTIKQETSTLATITYQNFFRLYEKLSGMTGTAKTEEEEFLSIYNMRVIEIPTHRPIQRMDYPDAVYGTKKAKFEALVNEIKRCHESGQPVLVGTISVETSEFISKMLKSRKIPHEVLNAKNHAREADIITKAGRKGSVTIATNMAGRGTDIKLGEGVKELGGLAVIGSERHESRRIDNQLRGRSGRQGDVGFSRFYVSVQDELMVRFGSERMEGIFSQLGDEAIESKMITKSIGTAQRRVEGVNFDVRKSLLGYDDVLRQQREIIYEQRNLVLDNPGVHEIVHGMFARVISNIVASHYVDNGKTEELDKEGLKEILSKMSFADGLDQIDLSVSKQEVTQALSDLAWSIYEAKIEPYKEKVLPIEKTMVLRVIDRAWINHIDTMSKLREGIHLRSYAQNNPLQAYTQEGYEMFEEMMQTISKEIVTFCMNVRIVVEGKKA
ncbi:MAG: preprotein translocase subunit SecA [Erysipelotrichaceae bacterium]